MSKLRKAAAAAPEAYSLRDYDFGKYMEALRAALAQPQIDPVDEYRKGFIAGQIDMRDREETKAEPVEPVAWINALKDAFFEGFTSVATYNDTLLNSPEEAWGNYKPPRAAPPQRKPLTEEEIYRATGHCGVSKYTAITITRAVERAHGIGETK